MGLYKTFALVFLVVSVSSSFDEEHFYALRRGLFHRLRHLEPTRPSLISSEDQWFEQRLDHFDPTNVNTWQQRYFSRYEQSDKFRVKKVKIIGIVP